MDEALSHYLRALSDPEIPVSISDVEKLMKEYPFFTLPAVTLLQREGQAIPADTRRRLMEQVALNTPEPSGLAMLTDSDAPTWANFYPAEKKKPVSTEDVIDTFLATYGHSSPKEDALLERLIFNPPADYSAILANGDSDALPAAPSAADNSQDALINAFILKNSGHDASAGTSSDIPADNPASTVEPVSSEAPVPSVEATFPDEVTPPGETAPAGTPLTAPAATAVSGAAETAPAQETTPDATASPVSAEDSQPSAPVPSDHPTPVTESNADTSLSESLAKIYIRRRRYDKAFEIIHNLSLKNPKKSVYFADQLRFLRKLMLISGTNGQLASDSGSKE